MKTIVLQGPFLTRSQAAGALDVPRDQVRMRPDLLRVTGLLEECYFGFQCHSNGLATDLARVVLSMRGPMSDLVIADWLVRPNLELKDLAPLTWLERGGDPESVLLAAKLFLDNG